MGEQIEQLTDLGEIHTPEVLHGDISSRSSFLQDSTDAQRISLSQVPADIVFLNGCITAGRFSAMPRFGAADRAGRNVVARYGACNCLFSGIQCETAGTNDMGKCRQLAHKTDGDLTCVSQDRFFCRTQWCGSRS